MCSIVRPRRPPRRDVERQRDRFGLLLRMTNTIASTLDLREVFKAVSLCLREMVPQEYASLILCDGQERPRPPPCFGLS
jgi:formate hydrogenlyase transcriptional activator